MTSERGLGAAFDDVARLGPFFCASANPAEAVDPTWRPWRTFYDDPGLMAARVDLVAGALGTTDRRVAASIALQGLAARLVSPILAVAAAHRLVPPWTPESLHWRLAVSGPWPMWESATEQASRPASQPASEPAIRSESRSGDDEVVAMVASALVEPHLAALVEATRAVESVSERVLRGNVASAVAAAGGLVARVRPDAASRSSLIVAGLLETRLLSGAGRFETDWSFRRRSCCLYYRVPGGGTCGDCVLVRAVRQSSAEQPGD